MGRHGFFVTEMDPRARVRGSRDGVAAQVVWSALARPLIGNLTTVTSSVHGFTTLLVGVYLAERAGREDPSAPADDVFLMWEQIAGYARHLVHDHRGFFGVRQVARRAAVGAGNGGRVSVSPRPEHQILSNQRTDGLLGNYTAPARASGLVTAGFPVRLTDEAASFVEQTYLPQLATGWGRDAGNLVRMLSRGSGWIDVRPNPRLNAVAAVVDDRLSNAQRRFYHRHLVEGGPHDSTGGRQSRLAQVVGEHLAGEMSHPLLATLAEDAERRGWGDVTDLLRKVSACESVLAPATALFKYALGRNGDLIDTVADDVRSQWGDRLETVHAIAGAVLPPGPWRSVAEVLSTGDYGTAMAVLAEHNAAAMSSRGGLPWLEVSDTRRLVVRLPGEAGDLPDRDAVRKLWVYSYFIPSLRAILRSIQQATP